MTDFLELASTNSSILNSGKLPRKWSCISVCVTVFLQVFWWFWVFLQVCVSECVFLTVCFWVCVCLCVCVIWLCVRVLHFIVCFSILSVFLWMCLCLWIWVFHCLSYCKNRIRCRVLRFVYLYLQQEKLLAWKPNNSRTFFAFSCYRCSSRRISN